MATEYSCLVLQRFHKFLNEISLEGKHKELIAEISTLLEKQDTPRTNNTMRELIIKMRQQERYKIIHT